MKVFFLVLRLNLQRNALSNKNKKKRTHFSGKKEKKEKKLTERVFKLPIIVFKRKKNIQFLETRF